MKAATVLTLAAAMTGCVADPTPTITIDPADEDPSEFIATPNGFYHRDCVVNIGSDASIDDDGVTLADGRRLDAPSCSHAHYASRELIGASAPPIVEPDPIKNTAWKAANYKLTTAWWREITATWSVPSEPPNWGGDQTVFLFPALENSFTIVQPVLQFGMAYDEVHNKYIGGNYWTIGAWDCEDDTKGGKCYVSGLREVNVGDHLAGYATGTSCTSAGVCTWTVHVQDNDLSGAAETFVRHEASKMAEADVTLEAYDISSCADYPGSGAEAFDVRVVRPDYSTSTGNWTAHNHADDGCNEHAASIGYEHSYLYWKY